MWSPTSTSAKELRWCSEMAWASGTAGGRVVGAPRRQEGGLVDEVHEIGAGEARGAARKRLHVDVRSQRHFPHMNLEDLLTPGDVRVRHDNLAVETGVKNVLVSDDAIAGAQRILWQVARQWVEPAGATALAAILSGAYKPEPNERVAVLICGANPAPGPFD